MPQKQTSPDSSENPGAFKHFFSPALIEKLSKAFSQAYPEFNQPRFRKALKPMTSLEMKSRVHLIRDALRVELPQSFPHACRIILAAVKKAELSGFALWPLTEYVQTYGLAHHTDSLRTLEILTTLFTSEWAVRPFLREAPESTLKFLVRCARSKNVHVRRWTTEGSRPRLPWGERLNHFIRHPELTLPILEILRYDPELYVRKSVANHLNDITKDNPQVALKVLKRWNREAPEREREKITWITRHALRSLIKAGDPESLKLVGVRPDASVTLSKFQSGTTDVSVGERFTFSFTLQSNASRKEKIVIDYIVHYLRANGSHSAKVFKLKTFEVAPGELIQIQGAHHFREVTTRRHYPGNHRLEIQINGKVIKSRELTLHTGRSAASQRRKPEQTK